MASLQAIIDTAWQQRSSLRPGAASAELENAIAQALDGLERGELRIAEPVDGAGGWRVHEWLKRAVLLYFRITPNRVMAGGAGNGFDKVALRFAADDGELESTGARVVPPAVVRRGAFIGADAVLMPSYVNIGAWIGPGSMIDTWATVGSCAQIGANVHISGGAGIGGVLEPVQATPTIVEDGCFIGARSEIVEGVVVERDAVIGMGVFIGQSTRIYDRASGEIVRGRVPAGAVVVPGSLPADDGSHALACAVIVKRVDASTRAKTGINELLRAGD